MNNEIHKFETWFHVKSRLKRTTEKFNGLNGFVLIVLLVQKLFQSLWWSFPQKIQNFDHWMSLRSKKWTFTFSWIWFGGDCIREFCHSFPPVTKLLSISKNVINRYRFQLKKEEAKATFMPWHYLSQILIILLGKKSD